jgi:hypothetical protein
MKPMFAGRSEDVKLIKPGEIHAVVARSRRMGIKMRIISL